MSDDKLKELEIITTRIGVNLNAMVNTATTAELDGLLKDINKDLTTQKNLRNQTGIDKSNLNVNQIKTIKNVLTAQDKITSGLGLGQTLNITDINKSIETVNKVKIVTKQSASQTNIQNQMSSQTIKGLQRTPADSGALALWLAGKYAKTGAQQIGGFLEEHGGTIGKVVGAILKGVADVYEEIVKAVTQISGMASKFGNQLQEIVSGSDEAIRSTIQNLGLITDKVFGDKTKADKIFKNITESSKYLVQQIGIPFDPAKVAEFQKAYADISKTSLAFNETDYVTMGEVQKTLELSAQESAELAEMFVNMGGSVDDVASFYISLIENANAAGVNSKMVLKGMKDYFKSSELFKFGGGLQDAARIMSYAQRIRVDMGGMFKLMNKVADPEAAIDLAAQLQALDTAFLGLDPIDLLGAALNDTEKFTQMIMDPMRENINKYYDQQSGQLTTYGKNFRDGFMKIEGISEVFKSAEEFTDFLSKAGKESEIRDTIKNSATAYASWVQLSPEEQENMIGVLAAQYQKDAKGIKVTTGGQYVTEMTATDMRRLMASDLQGSTEKEKLDAAAKGAVSVKDQLEVNEMLKNSMMWNAEAVNSLNTLLSSNEIRDRIYFAGNTIMDVGLEILTDTIFKQMYVLMENIGLGASEAYLFTDLLVKEEYNVLSAVNKGFIDTIYWLDYALGGLLGVSKEDITPQPLTSSAQASAPANKSHGGVINTRKFSIPNSYITSHPKSMGSGSSSGQLANLLSSFATNKFGPGILTSMGGGKTNVVISGEIRNFINNKDAGIISGERVFKILEKQIAE